LGYDTGTENWDRDVEINELQRSSRDPVRNALTSNYSDPTSRIPRPDRQSAPNTRPSVRYTRPSVRYTWASVRVRRTLGHVCAGAADDGQHPVVAADEGGAVVAAMRAASGGNGYSGGAGAGDAASTSAPLPRSRSTGSTNWRIVGKSPIPHTAPSSPTRSTVA
jgi:hypothetical protein